MVLVKTFSSYQNINMASMSNPVQQLLNAEKKAAIVVNDARARKYTPPLTQTDFGSGSSRQNVASIHRVATVK